MLNGRLPISFIAIKRVAAMLCILLSGDQAGMAGSLSHRGGDSDMAIVNVKNAKELQSAITKAKGGDTIALAPGDYGNVVIKNRAFSGQVTIVSQEADNPAHVDALTLNAASNITFKSVDFGFSLAPGQSSASKMITIVKSNNVTFDDVHVHGSLDGNAGNDGYGIHTTSSQSISIINSKLEQLTKAVVFSKSEGINLSNNVFNDIRSDGAAFSSVQSVVIDNNRFTDFYPAPGDHPDAIQFFTNGADASSDIRITNNQILQGKGTGSQGIFLRDEQETKPFTNVLIENNLVYLSEFGNGITLLGGAGVDIVGNTVLSARTDTKKTQLRFENISSGTVKDNVIDVIVQKANTNLTVAGNLSLAESPTIVSLIPNLNAAAAAIDRDLIISGKGYQRKVGAAVGIPLSSILEPEPATPPIIAPAVPAPIAPAPVAYPVIAPPAAAAAAAPATPIVVPAAPVVAPAVPAAVAPVPVFSGVDWFGLGTLAQVVPAAPVASSATNPFLSSSTVVTVNKKTSIATILSTTRFLTRRMDILHA